jgi:hypothetical protein
MHDDSSTWQAAEAYMSLGNVSYARVNEDYFRQAIHFLRRASDTPGFPLPSHLQRQDASRSLLSVNERMKSLTDL